MAVFVLDSQGKALMPCTEKRARLLLERGRARVHRLVPMVIRLVDRQADSCVLQPLRLKLDPGSKTTGWLAPSLQHRIDTCMAWVGRIQRWTPANALKATGRGSYQRSHQRSHQDGKAVVIQGISHKHCSMIQRSDGYGYFFSRADNTGREQVRPTTTDAAHPALYLPALNGGVSRAV